MSLSGVFDSLRASLAELREAIASLQVTIVEDKPVVGSVVLVDRIDNVVMELVSTLEEAGARLARAGAEDDSTTATSRALSDAHALVNRFTAQYIVDLAAHNEIARLVRMGRERGGGWQEWSLEVKTAIERCTAPATKVASALVACWDEIAQRVPQSFVAEHAGVHAPGKSRERARVAPASSTHMTERK